jgi:hypothetical protein
MNNVYLNFKEQLLSLIKRKANNKQFTELIIHNEYCEYVYKKIANIYGVEKDELVSELVQAILLGTFLNKVFRGEVAFNRRFFELNIVNLARKLKPPLLSELGEDLESTIDIEQESIVKNIEKQQSDNIQKLFAAKLSQLKAYRNDIGQQIPINLAQFCKTVELTVEELSVKTSIARYMLINNPERYYLELDKVFGEYLELFKSWFLFRTGYIHKLLQEYGSYQKIYESAKLKYTYRSFVNNIDQLSLWQLEEIKINLKGHHV